MDDRLYIEKQDFEDTSKKLLLKIIKSLNTDMRSVTIELTSTGIYLGGEKGYGNINRPWSGKGKTLKEAINSYSKSKEPIGD
jgi:hypothetical protein